MRSRAPSLHRLLAFRLLLLVYTVICAVFWMAPALPLSVLVWLFTGVDHFEGWARAAFETRFIKAAARWAGE